MIVSSRGGGQRYWWLWLPGAVVAQERPEYVDEAPRQRDHRFGVALSFGSLACVGLSRWPVSFQAREGGHVEDVAQLAMIAAGPVQYSFALAGIVGHGCQAGVDGQPCGAAECCEITGGDRDELCTEEAVPVALAISCSIAAWSLPTCLDHTMVPSVSTRVA